MAEDTLQPRLIVPAFVKGFVDMNHLRLLETIEMRNHGIQLLNLFLLFVGRERSAPYTALGLDPLDHWSGSAHA